jgi:hypothetical protein
MAAHEGPEESSATTNAAPSLAARSAPHPYKITVPLMALSAAGAAVGLWWDPLQLWCNAPRFALAPRRGLPRLWIRAPSHRPTER